MARTQTGRRVGNLLFGDGDRVLGTHSRALRPATEGSGYLAAPPVRLEFHALRHSHKTWMIADGVPEVAQSRRLGHILGDRIQETYSHVAAEVEHRLLEALNDRWDKAVADSPDQPAWRS